MAITASLTAIVIAHFMPQNKRNENTINVRRLYIKLHLH